ncbi:hypothetical protein [Microbacterium album]|uniref:Uncharacterized protein n=1 Tax=Microbacterium album TaxID=2053191 RepID=A0A917IIW3_9MICO|nr:hypothetical protein [Microbacterium album]GGH50327.1 hypothetical protein GCM10010921_29010 [Microbacterium album]
MVGGASGIPPRDRYRGGTDGAPPLPPPGGYRGARRIPVHPDAAAIPGLGTFAAPPPRPRPRAHPLGWIALAGASLFALVLLGMLAFGATDAFYGVTALTIQLLVAAAIVAAFVVRRGRTLAGIALALTLLVNVATVGALSAVHTSAAGTYPGASDPRAAYPGVRGVDPDDILARRSLEQVRDETDALLERVRDRLSAEYGYTWVQAGGEDLRPERNGYGGESLLVEYTSPSWATVEPITDVSRKYAVMATIDEVLVSGGYWNLLPLNDPRSGIDPGVLTRFYGSDDPDTQAMWEWYSSRMDDRLSPDRGETTLFYATLHDLSRDPTGDFRAAREAQHARTGEPLEGLQLTFLAPMLLSEADREAFEQGIRDHPGG